MITVEVYIVMDTARRILPPIHYDECEADKAAQAANEHLRCEQNFRGVAWHVVGMPMEVDNETYNRLQMPSV